ncbi:4'-phosphopantetheinyl transferase superfamily protein [Gilvimarinus sp. SDUM040013]|uniref:4'-phosphopantetheinyl transferase superfamily protein n=1 Tax=Gilvimarinus gilvus TaxID=3058038 RepID=A0ABU4S1K7_9GAMM|nr:4'-phosphopantetheinyl transferase superfamily protein [Gilvimarinus sp. SDUM040013]MDO3387817.1 4'-phosphopantetheinyl transferase superfamily protein [Gilvimarinus sp. SDUM040013]MDX6851040.1 4'-phosphopantetheinyl transferase superfamily protein [Gilvimarinus sp. SDUM040013]
MANTHLHVVNLNASWLCENAEERARHWLTHEEWQRLQALQNVKVRQQRMRQKVVFYELLNFYLQLQGQRPEISIGKSGKPFLPHQTNQHFNLSHSGDWLAIILSQAGPVGIDIESPRKSRDLMAIARHYFHPREIEHMATLNGAEQHKEFYRLWTLKEAFFKARGTGISEGLAKIDFTVSSAPESDQNWPVTAWQYQHQQLVTTPQPVYLSYVLPNTDALPGLRRDFPLNLS